MPDLYRKLVRQKRKRAARKPLDVCSYNRQRLLDIHVTREIPETGEVQVDEEMTFEVILLDRKHLGVQPFPKQIEGHPTLYVKRP